jgi:hypothetical protein
MQIPVLARMYNVFIEQCVIRPQYVFLERAYNDYRTNSRPCRRGAANQCAVRMSIALGRAGFGLEAFQPRARVHSGDGACQTDGIPHVLGAEELAVFLRRTLGPPIPFRQTAPGQGCASAFESIQGQRGILYFDNCFTRAGETARSGDHIDLFNGRQYFNQIIHPQAGGDELTGGSLFGRAGQVWFWPLS